MPEGKRVSPATFAPLRGYPSITMQGGGSDPEQACPLFLGPRAEASGLWEATEPPHAGVASGLATAVERAPLADGDRASGAASAGQCARKTHTCQPTGAVEPVMTDLPADPGSFTESDAGNLSAVLDHEVARNTMRSYRTQWQNFMAWAMSKGVPAFPADPVQVAAYLAERIAKHGHKPATLRVAAAAIAFVHRIAGWDNPCARPEVKRTLRGATRKAGRYQKQAQALTADGLAAIRSAACLPRLGRGGRLESPQTAEARGALDIALISLMRDAMLRVSEAAALIWRDLVSEPDGTGRLLIRRSKTDPEGEGAVAFVSEVTMRALESIRRGASEGESVFNLRPNQMSRRIKMAARAAGLGDGFSGHSPRVGMARDLVRAGIELPSLMTAGRWRTPVMPAHYTRNEVASRGAVAQFYGHYRRAA